MRAVGVGSKKSGSVSAFDQPDLSLEMIALGTSLARVGLRLLIGCSGEGDVAMAVLTLRSAPV